jgi:hypothetical protein
MTARVDPAQPAVAPSLSFADGHRRARSASAMRSVTAARRGRQVRGGEGALA